MVIPGGAGWQPHARTCERLGEELAMATTQQSTPASRWGRRLLAVCALVRASALEVSRPVMPPHRTSRRRWTWTSGATTPRKCWPRWRSRPASRASTPSTIEHSFIFSLQEKALPAMTLLEKFTAVGRLQMEAASGRLCFWRKADDAVLDELAGELKSADRWRAARPHGNWATSPTRASTRRCSRPRATRTAASSGGSCRRWASTQAVLPYVDATGKDIVVKAARDGLGDNRFAFGNQVTCSRFSARSARPRRWISSWQT